MDDRGGIMQEGGNEKKKPEGAGRFIWHGANPTVPGETHDFDETSSENSGPVKLPEAYAVEYPEPDEKLRRRKLIMGILGSVLFAAILCAIALVGGKLGAFGKPDLSIGLSQNSPQPISANELSIISLYLKSQPWDKKKHNALKSLDKMKNLRYALDFFQKFNSGEIANMPAHASSIDDVIANYEKLAGSLISIDAAVSQKYTVTEGIMTDSNAPSTLLSLSGSQDNGVSVSILVIGSSLEAVKTGDKEKFNCIPVFSYSPDNKEDGGGIFFVTIPELLHPAG
jgi:hypothetical protein